VNLDVPWTPLRLEQRIGRVDRLGQSRPVHALTFVARHTTDVEIASGLRVRTAEAVRAAPFGSAASEELRHEASGEAQRLESVRRFREHVGPRRSSTRPLLAVVGRGSRPETFLALRLSFVDVHGTPLWDTVAAVTFGSEPVRSLRARAIRGQFGRNVSLRGLALAAGAVALHDRVLRQVEADVALAVAPLLQREQRLLDRLTVRSARLAAPLVQAGLFDRRALRDAAAQRRIATAAGVTAASRLARLRRLLHLSTGDRHLVFAIVRSR
jgi:hypothetical protein